MTTVALPPADISVTKELYDQRYRSGYMDDLGHDNRARVRDFLLEVIPPSFSGRILDFGTGNGRYAVLLRQLYPNARVFGVDVSDVAVDLAAEVHADAGITFLHYHELNNYQQFFHFVLSNHVLEHVFSLPEVAATIAMLVKPDGQMVHTMPCGNPGSLEYRIVQMTREGVRSDKEGAFFFEDPGHLRRVTSQRLAATFSAHGFTAGTTWFSGQFWDTLNWVTQSPPSAWRIASPLRARSLLSAAHLFALKIMFLALCCLRLPASLPRTHGHVAAKYRGKVLNVALAVLRPFYFIGKPTDVLLLAHACREWKKRRNDPRGSGQFMYFKRESTMNQQEEVSL